MQNSIKFDWEEFKGDLKEWVSDSACELSLDLLKWRLACRIGVDIKNESCQHVWLFVGVGPVHISLAVGRWGWL